LHHSHLVSTMCIPPAAFWSLRAPFA
jgi:hypothetical protein